MLAWVTWSDHLGSLLKGPSVDNRLLSCAPQTCIKLPDACFRGRLEAGDSVWYRDVNMPWRRFNILWTFSCFDHIVKLCPFIIFRGSAVYTVKVLPQESKIFVCVFRTRQNSSRTECFVGSELSKHLSNCWLRIRIIQKIEPVSEAVCKRDWHDVRYIIFLIVQGPQVWNIIH